MKSALQVFGVCLGIIAIILAITWISQGNDWFMYKVFAPKYESVRRETFEQSKAYNQGMIQELQNMQFEYLKEKDPKAKAALASIILHRAADYPTEKMPSDLRDFIEQLKRERGASASY